MLNPLQSLKEATLSGLLTHRLKDTSTVTIPRNRIYFCESNNENAGMLAAFLINEGYKMSPLLLSTVCITHPTQHR